MILVSHLTKETTSCVTHENLSFNLFRKTERSCFDCVDSTGVTVVIGVNPGVVFAQVGNALKATIKPRTTVVNIFVFVFDATLIMIYKE